MTKKEQSQAVTDEKSEVQNMINEGGLGADVYYINEEADKEYFVTIEWYKS